MAPTSRVAVKRIVLRVALTAIALFACVSLAGCGKQLARMEEHQLQLRQMVRANAEQMAEIADRIERNQQMLQGGILETHRTGERITSELVAVHNDQLTLHQVVQENDARRSRDVATLRSNQQQLQTSFDHYNRTTQAIAADLTAMQDTLERNDARATQTLAALAGNQGTLQTTAREIRTIAHTISADVGAVQSAHNDFTDRFDQKHQTLTDSIASLNDNQQHLSQQIRTNNEDLAAVAKTVADNKTRLSNEIAMLARDQGQLRDQVKTVDSTATNIREGVTAVQYEQTRLQEMMQANAEDLAIASAAITSNQDVIKEQLADVDKTTRTVAKDVTDLQSGQANLSQTMLASKADLSKTLHANAAELTGRLSSLAETQGEVKADITDLTARQSMLDETMQRNTTELTGRMANIAWTQDKLQAAVLDTHDATRTVASDVTTMRNLQDSLNRALQSGNESLLQEVIALAQHQDKLETDLSEVEDLAMMVATDVNARMIPEQEQLAQDVAENATRLDSKMTTLAKNQTNLETDVEGLTHTTKRVADNVAGVADNQNALAQTIRASNQQVTADLAAIDERQQQLGAELEQVQDVALMVAADVNAGILPNQERLADAVAANAQHVTGRLSDLEQNQGQIRTGVEDLQTSTDKLALDVGTVQRRQTALKDAIAAGDARLSGQVKDVSQAQTQIQSGLNDVQKIALMTATGVNVSLVPEQRKIAEAIATNNADLTARLTTLQQRQQLWLERMETLGGNVRAVAANIATIEAQVGKLQTRLDEGMSGLGGAIANGDQDRLNAQQSLAQEIQTLSSTMAQLKTLQNQLQTQLGRLQDVAAGNNAELISAIEQLKADTAAAAQGSAEVSANASEVLK